MENKLVEPGQLQLPEEVKLPNGGSHYEEYKDDGIYEYALKPNGRKDKSKLKITYNDGNVFEGTLKHGKYEGEGKYYWLNGGNYVGTFKNGMLEGNGKYVAANGDMYDGAFEHGQYVGKGKYTWSDGSFFEGSFKNGQLESGIYHDTEGNVYRCSYTFKHNGELKNSTVRLIQQVKQAVGQAEVKVDNTKKATDTKTNQSDKATKNKGDLLNKDKALLTAIHKSELGNQFKALYSGEGGLNEKAEEKFMAILNFFSGGNEEQMKRIYKSSKLYDEQKGAEHMTKLVENELKSAKSFIKQAHSSAKRKSSANVNANNNGATR